MIVAKVSREDCLTLDQVVEDLGMSRAMLYNYLNFLKIQRHKFPFDRRSYILKSDVDQIRRFMEENKK